MHTDETRQRLLEISCGERTTPGVARENYWFRRHEAAYRWLLHEYGAELAGRPVLDAGSGEGYGANILVGGGARVLAAELSPEAAEHSTRTYPRVTTVRANLDALPFPDSSMAAVITMQVIEHLWDLPGFLRQCRRVLRPGGLLVAATPNRLTFSPGLARGDKPTNLFHVEEFDAAQLRQRALTGGFVDPEVLGVHHGDRLRRDRSEQGDIVSAQVEAALSGSWPHGLLRRVAEVAADDFSISGGALDESLDLILVTRTSVADSA